MVTAKEQIAVDKFDKLMNEMNAAKEAWENDSDNDNDDDDSDNEQDGILQQAITLALEQGRGWKPGEKEAYLEKLLDDDYIPPLFANTVQEVEKSGLQEAFTSLIYDDSPTQLMTKFRTKGNEAFANGKRNVVKNMQYYRDAINYWYEALAWAEKIEPIQEGDFAYADTDDPIYNKTELQVLKGTICSNVTLAHTQLGNWGYVRDECKKGIDQYDKTNIKLWYRLAKAYEMLKDYESAGDAIDSGLLIDSTNADMLKLQKQLSGKIQKARSLRQQRERARAQRTSAVKNVWKHCNSDNTALASSKQQRILLGRIPLVATVTDDDVDLDDNENDNIESRWHNHLPNSGLLPTLDTSTGQWSWPCMFVYPSHSQSDFIKTFNEEEILALRMAEVFPELEDTVNNATAMPWDHDNEFICSQLAVYFEVHAESLAQARSLTNSSNNDDKKSTDAAATTTTGVKDKKKTKKGVLHHPDSVELLADQASCMRYYESSRALKGDEGSEMADLVRAVEQKHLYQLRKRWKKKHKSLWSRPQPCPVVRVHPAVTLRDILTDYRMVVPNFLVTLIMIPENHPVHTKFLEEHKCIGVLEPPNLENA